MIWAPDGVAWWPPAEAFLKPLHMPTEIMTPLAAPAQLRPPASLDDAGRAAFGRYLPSRSYEKAFATDAAGHRGWTLSERTKADAESSALKDCQKLERVCKIYVVGNDLAPAVEPPG